MIDLAQHHGEGPVLLANVAQRQAISRKYLHAVLAALRTSGLVRTVRGRGGGYVLTRDPADIRLDEVIRVLEGSFALTDCVDNASVCPRTGRCAARELWTGVGAAIEARLASVTLDALARDAAAREADPAASTV